MKTSIIAFVLAASAFAGAAQAAVTSSSAMPNPSVAQAHRDMGKTRAEVRNELVQAQKSGQIAALSNLYRGS
ncbi:DUF4148 domain-containing protein [Caballeronia grimmiae]|uniref:DUF4148 domain-containing protein n=1 Tax=Caballeronia grimmiae TaxID=1071679 RepID=UPI0038B6C874